jgi:ribosomal protein S18 acetylase RimI-like enzyme
MDGMRIRAATDHDWPFIWPFLQQVGLAGDTLTWDPATTSERARAGWMRKPPGRTVVAERDAVIVGSAFTQPNHHGPGAHVANAGFVVHPEHRRQGVGRALCAHVLEQAKNDGYRAMQFNAVVETNTGGLALWRSFGFETLAVVHEAFLHPTKGYVGLHIMYRRL